jgi:hypothetical protein
MNLNLTPTLSLIEALLIIAVFPGLLHVLGSTWLALVDMREQRRAKVNGRRLLAALSRLWGNIGATASLVLIFTLGLQLATAASTSNPSRSVIVNALIVFYIGLAILASVGAVMADRYWARLLARLAEDARQRDGGK